MSLQNSGDMVKSILLGVTGLKRVFGIDELPDSIPETPSAVILVGPIDYDLSLASGSEFIFRVIVFASKLDNPSSLSRLLPMMEETGNSIPSLLRINNSVKEVSNLGMGATVWGGIPYLSTEFQVKILG